MSGDLRALGFCICLNFEMPSWTDVALKAICGWLDGIGYLCAGYAKSTPSLLINESVILVPLLKRRVCFISEVSVR